MKKFLVGLVAAFLLGAGLVAVSGTAATAGDCPGTGPYVGCVNTSTTASVQRRNQRIVKLKYKVHTAGNAQAQGTVTMVITGPRFSKTITRSVPPGFGARVKLPRKGVYTVTIRFTPQANSVFEPSSVTKTFRRR